jgi:hypothetical protein
MRFPLEVVGAGKKEITCRIHIKYANNMDLKNETDDLDGKILKNYAFLKQPTLKTDFGCEICGLFKKGINSNQRTT